ncbi:MAG: hypothetical protein V4568_12055 [Pseudomonadota bacterium]
MAGSNTPGPLGVGNNAPVVDLGTSAKTATPLPGPVGLNASATTPTAEAACITTPSENDAEIEALNLAATARKAAYALKAAHPSVKFTSGRRSKEDQARAMASNVVKNRKWIEETYANSTLRTKCQDWVDKNTDKKMQAEVAEGLLSVFNTVGDAALGKFSKHLSGEAFDVQPVDKDAEAIKKTIRGLAGLGKFLDTEGGLVRWHAQF